ncbi:MAG: ComF family protein [Proteobacteria bacterium]|nr:ComF family protein [Pseudomonadota bacterium]
MKIFPSLFNQFVNLLIPPRCVKCSSILENKEGLCTSCWPLISFIAKPYCACCGRPFDFDIEESALCGSCSYDSPHYKSARSVFIYTAESRDLILKFKHTDSIHSAPLFATWMTRALDDLENPLCIPVPLHWSRLFMRTYNQAALLAHEIAKVKGWAYYPTLLKRQRRTPSQGYLSKKERIQNVRRAFNVPQTKKELLQGKKILLVDDVFTTGATLNACSKALLKAGAYEVHAVTLGRVVTP